MQTLLIDNRDLAFTVDTYGTFTFDDEESDIEWYNDENNTNLDYDDFDWTYDNKGYVQHLSENSVAILEGVLIDEVIHKIELKDQQSPQFYNYTTDSYTAFWTVDEDKLIDYINQDTSAFANHLVESWREFVNVPAKIDKSFLDEDDKMLVAMIDYYTRIKFGSQHYAQDIKIEEFDDESYILEMFEARTASEYYQFTPIKKEVK